MKRIVEHVGRVEMEKLVICGNVSQRKDYIMRKAEPDKHPRQCLNPNCIYESRIDSKYCSDECGKELARMRLTEILPNRCKQYFFEGPSGGPRSLEDEIKPKRAKINREVQKLTESEKNMMAFLNKLVEFIKTQLKLQPLGTEERYDDNLYEGCIVCGLPDIPLLKYTKHIELCWARSEKAISFGAPEKNNDMFYCEKYDSRTNSFCKRLKSLCPEHRKLGDEQHLKVCGYPKKWEDGMIETAKTVSELIEMEDPFGEEGCRTKKDACHKHHKWIPSLRGTIELEQACLFQKMYELCHEMHKLNAHAEWTTNALSIMMHKQPNIIDSEQMSLFNKSQSTSSSASAHGATTPISSTSSSSSSSSKNDDEMEDTAEFLANLAVQKEEETQNN
ncbi:CXXC-type zinc finger protein 1 [Caenorhabditis elegans]|uniref:Isoform b of CXXC-type zinc finger protein 1 n=1 Tax=Caenorhabditis elegans TaxID=6239 RepID=Q9XUE7-2|nr:CXXC-type zinc finger protein 1 [Caenorhabditis elegans]CAD89737.1 CXXC-type zinc finger protein 1 [Caenorhabditis elegans]|eukprot:NP_001023215.1 CFP1 (CpG-binding protein, CXXC Finger Protein 1) homolog [Caenorhabditis elegans]